jgi:tetratricopeptide (TPR) repeat protein
MEISEIRNKINELVSNDTELNEEQRKAIADALEQMYIEGAIPQKAMKISDGMMQFIYGLAYRLYSSGNYQKAQTYFYFLDGLNPRDLRYLTAYAACKMKLRAYEEALEAYYRLSLRNTANPFPPYHMGFLFNELGKPNAAYLHYAVAKELCGDIPELAELKEGADLNLKALENKGVLA